MDVPYNNTRSDEDAPIKLNKQQRHDTGQTHARLRTTRCAMPLFYKTTSNAVLFLKEKNRWS